MIVKTEKEVDVKDVVPTLAALKSSDNPQDVSGAPQQEQPTHRPTLKRPDEQPEPMTQQAGGAAPAKPLPSTQQEEPQWGTKPASGSTDQQPAESPEKTPQEQTKTPPL
jgi:hypothetical protein